jgi:ssDNA thymidine ADP-ribosyltransferase, DarT
MAQRPAVATTPPVPHPTSIYRIVHIDCLDTLLRRGLLHAPNARPNDGLPYSGIHATGTQADRAERVVPCGPQGTIGDYIGFYFGPRSPMLYRIHTGWNVTQVDQKHIIYLVCSAQAVATAGLGFVFTDRHTLATYAAFRDNLAHLSIVDFDLAYTRDWKKRTDEPDRQEKKQAEFLVHREMPLALVERIGVLDAAAEARVEAILAQYPGLAHPVVEPQPSWYY